MVIGVHHTESIGVAITVWIFAIMIRPLREHWIDVREQIHDLKWGRFTLASLMFAVFLLCFIPGIATALPNMIMGAK